MNKTAPSISVLMPVYNAEKYVGRAIDSILNQTFSDFELLIFDDASTDNSLKIIERYKDERIIITRYDQNAGYVRSMNEGIEKARGSYIARMDADDISYPERLEKQFYFMRDNAGVGVTATWYDIFGVESGLVTPPSNHDSIVLSMLLNINPIGNPSAMFRKELLQENNLKYDNSFVPSEDYHLWINLIGKTQFHILPEPLLKYCLHDENISIARKVQQKEQSWLIRKMAVELFLERSLTACETDALKLRHHCLYKHKELTKRDMNNYEKLYLSLARSNKVKDKSILMEVITQWESIVKNHKMFYLRKLMFSPLIKYSNYKFRDRMHFLIKK
jgi:glycosyltransferase involved in cell wall biosynthesis